MTNRGTARRTSIHTPKKDEKGNVVDEARDPTIEERIAMHRDEHPNDVKSFEEAGEAPTKAYTPYKSEPSESKTRVAKPKAEAQIVEHASKGDAERLSMHTGYDLKAVAIKWMNMFREALDIEAPELPIDEQGDTIEYAKGAGRGKEAIIEWLIKYHSKYSDTHKQNVLNESINQTLLL